MSENFPAHSGPLETTGFTQSFEAPPLRFIPFCSVSAFASALFTIYFLELSYHPLRSQHYTQHIEMCMPHTEVPSPVAPKTTRQQGNEATRQLHVRLLSCHMHINTLHDASCKPFQNTCLRACAMSSLRPAYIVLLYEAGLRFAVTTTSRHSPFPAIRSRPRLLFLRLESHSFARLANGTRSSYRTAEG